MMLAIATSLIWTGCQKDHPTEDDSPQLKTIVISLKDRTANGELVFNYNTWYEQDTISIYNDGIKKTVALPWAHVTSTSMPVDYKHPEQEFVGDKKTRRWQLAFNFCEDKKSDGINMFGLWDAYAQTMRVYSYLNELPNPLARSCFYQIESTAPCVLDSDTKMFMPANSTLNNSNWAGTIGNGLPVPSKYSMSLLPVTGTLDGQVNKGWLCFELNFGSGLTEFKNDDFLTLTLYGVQDISFTGTMDIKGAMNSTNGSITVPGNNARTASASLKATGSFLSDITDCITSGVEVGKETGSTAAGVITGLIGGAGAICSLVGECLDISKDKEEESDSTQYSLKLGFNMSSTGEINGSLKSNLGTNINPVSIDYGSLFAELPGGSPGISKAESGGRCTLGVWNLKDQPVLYVADDFVFGSSGDCNETYYASFLDPTSLELLLNRDNQLFPSSEVDSITLVAYDYVFSSGKYDVPSAPYKDFYGIPRETFNRKKLESIKVEANLHTFMLSNGADYNDVYLTRGNYNYNYLGTTSKLDGLGMDAYNLAYSPVLGAKGSSKYFEWSKQNGWSFIQDPDINFDDVYIAVCILVHFNNGHYKFFAERFLPVIKRFSSGDIPGLKERLSKAAAPEKLDGITLVFPFFDMQRDKAVRILDTADDKYPAVYISSLHTSYEVQEIPQPYGLRIRDWSEDAPGLIIQTRTKVQSQYHFYTTDDVKNMVALHNYLMLLDDWSHIDKRLEDMKMPTLDNFFRPAQQYPYHLYNIRTGESREVTLNEFNRAPGLDIFLEDKDGNIRRFEKNDHI